MGTRITGTTISSETGEDIAVNADSGTVNVNSQASGQAQISSSSGEDIILSGENVNLNTNAGIVSLNSQSSGSAQISALTGEDMTLVAEDIILSPVADLILDGLTWPTSDGTNGQVLSTNGAGQLEFADGGSGGSSGGYALSFYSNGVTTTPDYIYGTHLFYDNVSFTSNSEAYAYANTTGQTEQVFVIQYDDVQVGTITFPANTNEGTVSLTNFSAMAGHRLSILGSSVPNGQIDGVAITITSEASQLMSISDIMMTGGSCVIDTGQSTCTATSTHTITLLSGAPDDYLWEFVSNPSNIYTFDGNGSSTSYTTTGLSVDISTTTDSDDAQATLRVTARRSGQADAVSADEDFTHVRSAEGTVDPPAIINRSAFYAFGGGSPGTVSARLTVNTDGTAVGVIANPTGNNILNYTLIDGIIDPNDYEYRITDVTTSGTVTNPVTPLVWYDMDQIRVFEAIVTSAFVSSFLFDLEIREKSNPTANNGTSEVTLTASQEP